jgi:hypothetical protein
LKLHLGVKIALKNFITSIKLGLKHPPKTAGQEFNPKQEKAPPDNQTPKNPDN